MGGLRHLFPSTNIQLLTAYTLPSHRFHVCITALVHRSRHTEHSPLYQFHSPALYFLKVLVTHDFATAQTGLPYTSAKIQTITFAGAVP